MREQAGALLTDRPEDGPVFEENEPRFQNLRIDKFETPLWIAAGLQLHSSQVIVIGTRQPTLIVLAAVSGLGRLVNILPSLEGEYCPSRKNSAKP